MAKSGEELSASGIVIESGDNIQQVFTFASPNEICLAAGVVSRAWAAAANSDIVWNSHCTQLWADKVYVPNRFRPGGQHEMSRLEAFKESIKDANRTALTVEELCSFDWFSRMKGWAGSTWTEEDPWWTGSGAATVRKYHEDGTTSGGRGSGKWRFVPACCGRTGHYGTFVRHSREGRSYPTHIASRYAKNWGWVLQNCWGFSASFPLPPRGVDLDLEDDGDICQSVTVDSCQDEATRFNMGLPLPYDEEAGEGGQGESSQVMPMAVVQVNGITMQLPLSVVLQLMSEQESDAEGEATDEVTSR